MIPSAHNAAVARATAPSRFDTAFVDGHPSPTNPLGAKGIGEAGAIAAPSTLVNAVLDALAPLGVTTIDMPLTPERVLAAIDGS